LRYRFIALLVGFFFVGSVLAQDWIFSIGDGYYVQDGRFDIESSDHVYCLKTCRFQIGKKNILVPSNTIASKEDLIEILKHYESLDKKQVHDPIEDESENKQKPKTRAKGKSRLKPPYPTNGQAFIYNIGAPLYIYPKDICLGMCELQVYQGQKLLFRQRKSAGEKPLFEFLFTTRIQGELKLRFKDENYFLEITIFAYPHGSMSDVQILKHHGIVDYL
jgi:hypothetical protein